MRNRDAIRTFRIKQIHNNVIRQNPTYSSQDVLIHLITKLNSLFLPSPSPPPPSLHHEDHINTIQTKEIIDSTINQKNKVIKNKKNNDIQQASNQNYHDENPMNISK